MYVRIQVLFTISQYEKHRSGIAECMNCTLVDKVWCILSTAGVDRHFWAEAIEYVCHLVNQLPSTTLEKKTPMEVWSGNPTKDYHNLRVLGSPVYYHVREDKLDPRAHKAIFWVFDKG